MNGRIGKACRAVGCPRIGYERHSYCEAHAHLAKEDKPFATKNQERLKLYNTPAWKRMRAQIIKEHPLCQRCHRKASNVVHHILEARKHPELQLDPENLEALCSTCHNRESQRESLKSRSYG